MAIESVSGVLPKASRLTLERRARAWYEQHPPLSRASRWLTKCQWTVHPRSAPAKSALGRTSPLRACSLRTERLSASATPHACAAARPQNTHQHTAEHALGVALQRDHSRSDPRPVPLQWLPLQLCSPPPFPPRPALLALRLPELVVLEEHEV
ncbi:hypothetical protein T492DRAFT_920843 [Pavlovales sp. CCMP2436]|nr:hypothetical protein T492DRAFT_920843 [Pavlovales sp. CCMP2436]